MSTVRNVSLHVTLPDDEELAASILGALNRAAVAVVRSYPRAITVSLHTSTWDDDGAVEPAEGRTMFVTGDGRTVEVPEDAAEPAQS